jgi:hypothetical protein
VKVYLCPVSSHGADDCGPACGCPHRDANQPAGDQPAMLVWAALVAALIVQGFATALLGMVVIFAWLGHATWLAYQELVE